jgi:predicted O-linked N-acetylglucosamine transferase (SPINDLY family)
MAPKVAAMENHLARLQCADLFLDTTPYNAHATCSDALWMGLPVITCAGESFPSRVAGSLLTAIGLPELIARNLDEYYSLALTLATDLGKRQKIRSKIIDSWDSAPLFDSERFTRSLEDVFRRMWAEYTGRDSQRFDA